MILLLKTVQLDQTNQTWVKWSKDLYED